MRTARQALTDIAALQVQDPHVSRWLYADQVHAVLADVEPETAQVQHGQLKQVWATYCSLCNSWLSEWNSDAAEAEIILREHQDELHD